MDDQTKADLGKALADAIGAGDGQGIYDAFEALSRACEACEMEPDQDDSGKGALVLALGAGKGKGK